MIRWSYLAPRLAVLAVFWVFSFFFFDPMLKYALETTGTKSLGARVEIGGLKTKFFPPAALITRVSAADRGDPMKNLIEFASAGFNLERRPLLEKKLVVSDSSLLGIRFGTPRRTSGALKGAAPAPAETKLDDWSKKSTGLLGDSLGRAKGSLAAEYKIDPAELKSVKLAKQLQDKWGDGSAWQKKAGAFDAQGRAAAIESKIKELGNENNPLKKAQLAKQLSEEINSFRKDADAFKNEIGAEIERSKAELEAVKRARDEDLAALRSKMKLPSFDAESLSAYLLGPKTAGRAGKTLRLVETARAKLPAQGAPPAPPAGRGMNVAFPKAKSWPAVWLRRIKLAGEADLGGPLTLSGEARDFSSNPPLVPEPAVIELSGDNGGRTVKLSISLDHRSSVPVDKIRFRGAGNPVEAFTAGDPSSFALKATPGTAAVELDAVITGDDLSGTVRIRETGMTLEPVFGQVDSALREALASGFSGLKTLEITVSLGGTLKDPSLKLSSNLGTAAADGFRKSLGKKFAEQESALRSKLDGIVGERTRSLDGVLAGRQKDALAETGVSDQKIDDLKRRLQEATKLPVKGLPSLKGLFR